MPTRQFDGTTLEEALAKVRSEVGADARITGAEKVRTGGVAGFFAKERIEVTVEVDEPAAAASAAVGGASAPATHTSAADAPAAPRSILDLADSISDAEQNLVTVDPAATPAGTVSPDTSTFASVLERISTEADSAVAAQTSLDGPFSRLTEIPLADTEAVVAAAAERRVAEPVGVAEPHLVADHVLPVPADRALAAFTALARRSPREKELEEEREDDFAADDELPDDELPDAELPDDELLDDELLDDEPVAAPMMAEPNVVDDADGGQTLATAALDDEHEYQVGGDVDGVDPQVGAASPTVATEPAGPPPAPWMVASPSAALAVPAYVRDLERLGVPGGLVPAYAEDDLFDALVARFEMLPHLPSLPRTKGTVLAVVGPLAEAMEIARELAVDVRTHPRDIIVCGPEVRSKSTHKSKTVAEAAAQRKGLSWFQLSSVDDAEEQRRGWRWRLEPTVVVIDAPFSRADRLADASAPGGVAWARDMLNALEPHSVWGVVDGGRKVEDLAAWSDQIGGLDAVAVTGVAATMTPASVLHLGLPVAMIDGEPASPELWAEILMDRIAA